jgi:ATPase subunit of ABC transporter with duplicated ATPase domains
VHISSTAQIGYLPQDQPGHTLTQSPLEMMLSYFPNETSLEVFLAHYLFTGEEPLKPISIMSFGQRTRRWLARLVAKGANCLLLDGPINHLDILSRTQFELDLSRFNGAVLALAHDRYFIPHFADEVWWEQDGRKQQRSNQLFK